MNEIKRVLILTREYQCSLNPKVGGTGIFYKNLSLELKKRGIEVNVFLISKKYFEIKEHDINIYSIKDIFKANPILELLRSFTGKFNFLEKLHNKIYLFEKKIISKRIKSWIKDNNYTFNIIETHDFEGLALAIPNSLPSVIRCHGSWTILEKYFGYKKVHKGRVFCEKLTLEKSKNIITISKYNEKINKDTFEIKNTKLIYNGIDEKFYKPLQNIKQISKSIFYLGNVSFEKGADTLLKSFLKVIKIYPDATLHFIGNPNHYENLIEQDISYLTIKKSIIFYGNKNREDILQLINKAEIVCFPSKGENFSLSLLEVMAMQKPVICSDIDSFKEIIQNYENGLIATENNFHQKIGLIFENNDLKNKISLNARKLIESDFGIDKMVTETINYYKEII
ncbi:glycosyltransferase family 4 protein [Chryseobacterium turcicum]|uniref:Glycosyltransferase family 4 protein n=1 Tax=Chryseobacterium turcicum TaxID=2898076 RepID=A0A9Q3V210_9FLAO|nr:glycosyltransferase family 4 protein [Chryseobacterium turcicum]MCD1115865.1 glycosyltransferase family 4 protein [Chryseobacterium turcicum]